MVEWDGWLRVRVRAEAYCVYIMIKGWVRIKLDDSIDVYNHIW
jgi:hypothetical protein